MAKTEIQKVPGAFTLAPGWPKLEFPKLVEGVVAEYNAQDLALGPTPAWQSRVGNLPAAAIRGEATPNVVAEDPDGKKHMISSISRYTQNGILWPKELEMTFLAVVRPSTQPASSNSERIISGPLNGFRSLQRGTSTYRVGVTSGTKDLTPAGVKVGKRAVIIGRFRQTEITGQQFGGTPYTMNVNPSTLDQTYALIGGNDSTALDTAFQGSIYRIIIWGRPLSDMEMQSALQENAALYNVEA